MNRFPSSCFVILPILLLAAAAAHAQSTVLPAHAVSAGAMDAQNTTYTLQGTVGAMPAGQSFGPNVVLQGGFWMQTRALNTAPVLLTAATDTATTQEDTPIVLRVLENDVGPEGGTLTLTRFSAPGHGDVQKTGDSTLVYTPGPDYFGQDQFTYTIHSSEVDSARGTVRITVTSVNDAPVFTSTPATEATVGSPYRYEVEAVDVESDPVSFAAASQPDWLSLTDANDGQAVLEGTPTKAHVGSHDIILHVSDGAATTDQTFTVSVVLAAPAAPLLAAPEDGATGLFPPVELTWEPTAGAVSYHLQIADRPDFSSLRVDTTGLTETTFGFSNLEAKALYYWRVRGVNDVAPGPFSTERWFETAVSVASDRENVPTTYRLEPNYPNPFNPSTRIRFALPKSGRVALRVFDVRGRLVARVIDREMPPGVHDATWDGRDDSGRPVPSGVYFYRLDAEHFSRTRGMVLLK